MVILCGGQGTRLQEHTQAIPKPLVEIGGLPIVWHVIQLYAVQGFERFLLATGYKGELIERFAKGAHHVFYRVVIPGLHVANTLET